MTVIVAAKTSKGVTLAADSQSTGGWIKHRSEQPKLWTNGKYAFGAAGCTRTIQVMRYHVEWPKYRPDEHTEWERFLVIHVVPAIREGVGSHGVIHNDSGVQSINASLVIATGDQFATVDGNGCVTVEHACRTAVGSGGAQALGALGASGPWTEDDVIQAARRAGETAVGVDDNIATVNTSDLIVRAV